ncbi:MAG: hypothetical protein IPJ69_09995 [Deltaproteobacteria bacterium]|nr:MAG: hypothetical protein IPJ69_09995 [Deltaproteobacteria bacterium]
MKKEVKKTSSGVGEAQESFFLQFPEIEKILKKPQEDFQKHFGNLHESLEKLSRTASGMNKKKETRKAMKAVERTMDLFRDLFRMKSDFDNNEKGGVSKPHAQK